MKHKYISGYFPRQEDVTLVIGCGGQSHNAVTLAHSRINAQHLQPMM